MMPDFRNKEVPPGKPLVTIGLSSYNYAHYILDSLNSLISQTYPLIELIIIDDCSTDNSVEIINTWIKENNINCTFIIHKQNRGISKTLNEMVKLSKGKYFVMFASDDIMLPERVERQVDILETVNDGSYGLCYAHPLRMDEEGSLIGKEKYSSFNIFLEGDVMEAFLKKEFWFVPPACMLLKSAIVKTGYYNEEVLLEDYNFFVRFLLFYKVKFCSYPCIIYRERKGKSQIVKQWEKNNGERYFYDRIISNVSAWRLAKISIVKSLLEKKIYQYLKCLAVYNSSLFYKSVWVLLRNNYLKIPMKFFFIKSAKSLGILPKSEIVYEDSSWF